MIELRIIGIIIGIIATYMSFLYYKNKLFSLVEYMVWTILWIGFLVVAITPNSFNFLLEAFQLERTSDLIMIIAFIVIYVLGFRNYITNRRLQRKLEDLIRKEALKDLPKD